LLAALSLVDISRLLWQNFYYRITCVFISWMSN